MSCNTPVSGIYVHNNALCACLIDTYFTISIINYSFGHMYDITIIYLVHTYLYLDCGYKIEFSVMIDNIVLIFFHTMKIIVHAR